MIATKTKQFILEALVHIRYSSEYYNKIKSNINIINFVGTCVYCLHMHIQSEVREKKTLIHFSRFISCRSWMKTIVSWRKLYNFIAAIFEFVIDDICKNDIQTSGKRKIKFDYALKSRSILPNKYINRLRGRRNEKLKKNIFYLNSKQFYVKLRFQIICFCHLNAFAPH